MKHLPQGRMPRCSVLRRAWMVLVSCLIAAAASAQEKTKIVHVFVALADNASQGIAPVPAKIGNGDDADANLYWGTTDGLKSVFGRDKAWKLEKTEPNPAPEILERRAYRHTSRDCVLIAEAWRGRNIHECSPICASGGAIWPRLSATMA